MHPLDDWGHPLSVVLALLLAAWVASAFLRAWRDERRERRELRAATRQMAALDALRRLDHRR